MLFTLVPLKRLMPNGSLRVIGVFRRGQKRQRKAAQVRRVEHRAEIDVESFRPLSGENFDAGRCIGVNTLRREIFVFRHRRRSDVGRHGDQLLALEQLGPFVASHFGDRISLTAVKAFRARAVELGDALNLGNRNIRIADIGQRKFQ